MSFVVHDAGAQSVQKLIDTALVNTSVTVVLIGARTTGCKFINYEIEKSIEVKNGILGIHIHNIKDAGGKTDEKGAVPAKLLAGGYKVCTWPFDSEKFAQWVEDAAKTAGR